jgi:hypothetical protein
MVEEHERAAAATATMAARLAAVELVAARAEVQATTAVDATRATAAELKALRDSSTSSSAYTDDDTNAELRLARDAA